ncbi:MAG: DegT/DnrJ/EryC1/StrS family aminotransferase [Deltaproteobacteria bacterium]|nr:DegT/DnrJ/EryC1/StrS family aminotransferase [Deltaproteobacteria bacterium]
MWRYFWSETNGGIKFSKVGLGRVLDGIFGVIMISRTKPNYGILDLIGSFCLFESSSSKRNLLTNKLQDYFNNRKILLTPSGRGGLYVLLSCLKEQKVFIPAYTCKAVVEAVKLAGKSLEFVEIEDDGFNVDCEDLRGRLDSDSVLLITHQFGFCAKVDQLMEMAFEAGAVVLEDAAASFGSKFQARLTGTFGQAGFFSFDSTKRLNAPLKGGFLIFNDEDLYNKAKSYIEENLSEAPFLKKLYFFFLGLCLCIINYKILYPIFHWFKFKRKNHFTDESFPSSNELNHFYKYKLTEFQANIIIKQLDNIDLILKRNKQIWDSYSLGLKNLHNIIRLRPLGLTKCPFAFPLGFRAISFCFIRNALG